MGPARSSITVATKNAVTGPSYTLVTGFQRYLLPRPVFLDDETLVRAVYRRLFRLRPFVSQRAMVRNTYTEYLRYKFTQEDYMLKRSILLQPVSYDVREQLLNSLEFVLKAVSYLPETKDRKFDIARDNTICRQVLKNLLTIEYEKNVLIAKSRTRIAESYSIYRKTFTYLDSKLNELSDYMVQQKAISAFDTYLIYLNEMIGTRL